MLNVREYLSWRFGHVWRSRFLNLASVTFGVLFSYASIIFGEFYFGESKEPCETRVIKFLRKLSILQYSVLYLHINHSDCSVIQGRWVKLTDKKPKAASKMQWKYYIYIYLYSKYSVFKQQEAFALHKDIAKITLYKQKYYWEQKVQ